MFQGGFVGKICQVLHWTDNLEFVDWMRFYPEDINPLQISPLPFFLLKKTVVDLNIAC
jgi:hypothetical protein